VADERRDREIAPFAHQGRRSPARICARPLAGPRAVSALPHWHQNEKARAGRAWSAVSCNSLRRLSAA